VTLGLKVEAFCPGPPAANTYVVYDETSGDCLVVDPGPRADSLRFITGRGLRCLVVINTHGHYNHIAGNDTFKTLFGCSIALNERDHELVCGPGAFLVSSLALGAESPVPDLPARDGDRLRAGSLVAEVMHAGVHTPGSIICCVAGGRRDFLFTGDILFADGWGSSTDPDAGMRRAVWERVSGWPSEALVMPGHGPAVTVVKLREVIGAHV